jgi:hypothetical protein
MYLLAPIGRNPWSDSRAPGHLGQGEFPGVAGPVVYSTNGCDFPGNNLALDADVPVAHSGWSPSSQNKPLGK